MENEQRIDTSHETWLFDRFRRRYRRLPLGRDPTDPSFMSSWQPYFALWPEPDGGFTLQLDAYGTRRHRVVGEAA
jgi:hypothetical protein